MSASRPNKTRPTARAAALGAGLIAAVTAALAAGAAQADVTVEGVEDEDLLGRIQAVLPDEGDPDNRVEARRIAQDAAERADAVLRSRGYYGAQIEATSRGEEDAEAVIVIEPGERFTVSTLEYAVDGNGLAQDAARPDTAQAALIAEGDPLIADDVIAEGAAAVTRLREGGYPDAAPGERDIVVDHATNTALVTYNITAGRPAVFGDLRIEADTPVRRDWLMRLATHEPGERYAPARLQTLSGRVSGTRAFDNVSVRLEPSEEGMGEERRDVIVEITQGDRHAIELGAGYATSDGFRLEGEWSRMNMFGAAETLTLGAVAATMERSVRADFRAPHFYRPNRTLTLGAEGIQEETDAYDRLAAILRAGAEQPLSDTLVANAGVSLEQSRVEDRITGERDLTLFTTHGELRYDDTGDPLDPRNGLRGGVRLEPGIATGDDDLTFVKAIVDISAYRQVSDSPQIVLAARARAGTIYGASAADLPADRRFYAGGGGSVRGYDYQSLGPRDDLNDPLGGRSLLELGAEARFRVVGNWGGAVFVDAGNTKRGQTPGFEDLRAGAGAGVRYYTPFGPIRADIATPLNPREGDSRIQLYISIGQAF